MPQISFKMTDKLAHFLVYFILSALMVWEIGKSQEFSKKQTIWTVFGLTAIYGIVIEMLQGAFFVYRYFEIMDIFANITGSICGVLLIALKK